jgi:hypothetical protein
MAETGEAAKQAALADRKLLQAHLAAAQRQGAATYAPV